MVRVLELVVRLRSVKAILNVLLLNTLINLNKIIFLQYFNFTSWVLMFLPTFWRSFFCWEVRVTWAELACVNVICDAFKMWHLRVLKIKYLSVSDDMGDGCFALPGLDAIKYRAHRLLWTVEIDLWQGIGLLLPSSIEVPSVVQLYTYTYCSTSRL